MQAGHRMLIVIADGEHARFLHIGSRFALHTDRVLDSIAAHRQASDLGTDRPGATFHSYSTAHHSLAPHNDPQMLEKAKFARFVAEELNAAAMRDEFQELVLVAPPHVLDAVRGDLRGPAATRIVGTLAKDLVKTPDSELLPHLRQWVRRARPRH